MSIKTWFGEHFAGPESICKILLKAYNRFLVEGCDKKEALRLALESRYAVIKTIPEEDFDAILSECTDLGSLAYVCIVREQPQHGGGKFVETMARVGNFYATYAPEHAEGLADFLARFTAYVKAAANQDATKKMTIFIGCEQESPPLKSLLYSLFKQIDEREKL